jgi:hypothetical protein
MIILISALSRSYEILFWLLFYIPHSKFFRIISQVIWYFALLPIPYHCNGHRGWVFWVSKFDSFQCQEQAITSE